MMSLVSCIDDLNKAPLDKLSPETYFTSAVELELFSNSFYNNLLKDNSYFKHQSDQYIKEELTDALRGGNHRIVPNSGGGWSWEDLRKLNTMLAYIHNCDDQAAVDKYTGVCKFFRAWIYAEKVMRFGDVPWVDVELGSADPALYNSRDSREYVLTKMIEDIDDAIAKLPSDVNPYRVNKWSALALKARFCLFEGTFRKYHAGTVYLKNLPADAHDYNYYLKLAAEAAKKIIDEGPYELYSTNNPDKDYLTLFATYNATSHKEYILAIDYDNDIPIRHSATGYAMMTSQKRAGATKKIIDSYLMKNGERFTDKPGWETMEFKEQVANRDPRLAQSFRTLNYVRLGDNKVSAASFACSCTGYHTVKFVQDVASGADSQTEMSFNDLPVIRYAEVLLNYAEAMAEYDGSEMAISQNDLDISVNLLRKRVGMPDMNLADANANPDGYLIYGSEPSKELGYRNVKGSNQGVILEIRRERTIELAQEGEFRWYDLMRWREGLCINEPMYGMYFPGEGAYDLTGDGKPDVALYKETPLPGLESTVVQLKIGDDIKLSGEGSGYVDPHQGISHEFDENKDYLYPIPINERSLNKNLTQNPGWNDGLSF